MASTSCTQPRSRRIAACGREKSLIASGSRARWISSERSSAGALRKRSRSRSRPSGTLVYCAPEFLDEPHRTPRRRLHSEASKGKKRTFLLWRKPDICTLGRQGPKGLVPGLPHQRDSPALKYSSRRFSSPSLAARCQERSTRPLQPSPARPNAMRGIGIKSPVFSTTDTRHYDKWARSGNRERGPRLETQHGR